MKYRIKRLAFATLSFIVVAVFGTFSLETFCFPATSHGPVNIECTMAMYSPVYAAIAAGFVASWKFNFWSLLFASVASVIGLAILWKGFLFHWYGSDILYAIQFVTLWCLVPALITSSIFSGVYLYRNKHAL